MRHPQRPNGPWTLARTWGCLHGGYKGQIVCAAVDVTDPEPLPATHKLLDLPNLLVVPHTAGTTVSSRTLMAQRAVRNLVAGLRGEPLPYCVNPEVYGWPEMLSLGRIANPALAELAPRRMAVAFNGESQKPPALHGAGTTRTYN